MTFHRELDRRCRSSALKRMSRKADELMEEHHMKYRRFTYTGTVLAVDQHGDLIEYNLYKKKKDAIDAIWEEIGEDVRTGAEAGDSSMLTLTNEACKKLLEILENA